MSNPTTNDNHYFHTHAQYEEAKSELRRLMMLALDIESCAVAVAKVKDGPSIHGHPVLDAKAAVEALVAAAPPELAVAILAVPLNEWQKIQALNALWRDHIKQAA